MYFERIAERSPEELQAEIPEILARQGFALLSVREPSEEFLKLGRPVREGIWVYEVTVGKDAREAFQDYPQALLVSPLRVLVFTEAGQTKVGALLPTAFVKILPKPKGDPRLWQRLKQLSREYDKRFKALVRDMCKRKVGPSMRQPSPP